MVETGSGAAALRPSIAASAIRCYLGAVHYPDLETFAKLAAGARLVPVYRRLVGDGLTPVSAFHKLDQGPCACLFESVVGGEKVGRYSFLTANPFLQVEARGNRMTIVTPQGTDVFESPDPLA